MDKRLLLFVVSLSATLFFVNFYFQKQHDEELRIWNQARQARNEQRIKQLEEEIKSSTLPLSEFNVVDLFSDQTQKEVIGKGFLDDRDIFFSIEYPPDQIFAENKTYQLQPDLLPANFHLYSSEAAKLRIGDLPDFGQFNLTMLTLDPLQTEPARYVDGQFSLLSEQLQQLKEPEVKHTKKGIILLKVEQEWLPVGIYDGNKTVWLEEISNPNILKISPQGATLETSSGKAEEQFYVLENEFLQLVFSTYGGALSEINLPFKSEENPHSVVRKIAADREMIEEDPQNALFPLHAYFTPSDGGAVKNAQGHLGGYYPLLRRDLIGRKNEKIVRIPPKFYGLNIVSEYPEVAELVYEVKEFSKNQIVLEAKQSHRKISKTFTLPNKDSGGPYCFDISIKVEGDSRGLWIGSGIPEVEWISGGPAPALKYRITRNQKSEVNLIDLPQESTTISSINPDWACNSNGFFGLIVDPLIEIGSGLKANYIPGVQAPSRLVEIDREYNLYPADKMPGYNILLPLKSTAGQMQFRVFAGPFASDILRRVDATYADPETGYNPDYISAQTFHGWFAFISEPFAKFLFFLMKWFYFLTGSWGFSIILLTVALRIMLYPLNAWSLKSTIQMQKIAPEIKAIQEKYKKDPQKAQLEIVNLYRERKVNPLSGCLPLLIQMPFLIGMFDLLKSAFELRGAPFIPGWIDDLSAPDVLFRWNYPIFFIGNELHLLPFVLGGVMFLQQRMMSTVPTDANEMTDQQRQQRAMGTMMTVVFTLMFYNFPSGLNIYWLSSMILGMIQQWWTNRQMSKATVLPALGKKK